MKRIDVGVVGATGLVGEAFLDLIARRRFPFGKLKLFASENSAGQAREVSGNTYAVESLKPGCFDGLQLVFFSSGDDISKQWAPEAAKSGAYAVDNSAAHRMDPSISLVVPEVNAHAIPKGPAIIANPNCSTIQLVVVLNALKAFGLKSVRIASYQAASGAGKLAQQELMAHAAQGLNAPLESTQFPVSLAYNVIPQIGAITADGYCSEETKIRRETKKILEMPSLFVSAFTVRVPVWNAHSEAVWVEFDREISRDDILGALHRQIGLDVHDAIDRYPFARAVSGHEPTHVGRIHRDAEDPRTWRMWIVADNLWKGAALNGLQIAEKIFA